MKSLVFGVLLFTGCEHGKGGAMVTDGGGTPCGAFGSGGCSADQFCDFGGDTCGTTDVSGFCRPRPTGCGDNFDPVCGCDGQIHTTPCDANAAGIDLDASGQCPLAPDQFACGFKQCSISGEFCQHTSSDVGGEPDGFTCAGIPTSCGSSPSCACLASQPCGSFCTGDAATGFRLDCPGG